MSDDRKGETIPHGETGGHAFVRGGFYHANTSKRFEREKEDGPIKEPDRVLGVLGLGSLQAAGHCINHVIQNELSWLDGSRLDFICILCHNLDQSGSVFAEMLQHKEMAQAGQRAQWQGRASAK